MFDNLICWILDRKLVRYALYYTLYWPFNRGCDCCVQVDCPPSRLWRNKEGKVVISYEPVEGYEEVTGTEADILVLRYFRERATPESILISLIDKELEKLEATGQGAKPV